MGTTTETALLTFEEFEQMEEKPEKQELLEGELIEMPPPETKHSRKAKRIFKLLDDALIDAHSRGEAKELGEVFMETGYRLTPRNWFVPDVSITHALQAEVKYFEGAPALAIEIVSPHDRAAALDRKTEIYFAHGAPEVWRLYQQTRHMVIHAGSPSQIRVESETVSTPLLPGFVLNLRDILGD
jgi:Uma2 family endonuclease